MASTPVRAGCGPMYSIAHLMGVALGAAPYDLLSESLRVMQIIYDDHAFDSRGCEIGDPQV